MELRFSGRLWEWRGPAPHVFVNVPEDVCAEIELVAKVVSYGWGMVPVTVEVGATRWTTSLWPKDGGYVVPIKAFVRRAEGLELGMTVELGLSIEV